MDVEVESNLPSKITEIVCKQSETLEMLNTTYQNFVKIYTDESMD